MARAATPGSRAGRAAAVAVLLVALPAADSAAGGAERCRLFHPDAARVDAGECLTCHGAGQGVLAMQFSHVVGIDYAAAQAANPYGLRSAAEVVRRGVLLPDGKIQCVTCHDGRSPWASRIALPAGAIPTPAVDPRNPATYLQGRSWRAARPGNPPLPPGSAVTPSPLCAVCHALAD